MSDAAGGRGIRIADVLRNIVAKGASDIHLQAGAPPYMRVDGELYPFEGVPTLTPEQTEQIALAMMSESQREVFRHRHEVDFAFTIPNIARFRCNVLRQRGSVGVVMRVIRDAIPSFESLGLPGGVVTELVSQPRGLVLVTGPTGSGKTTTLAAMIDFINRRFARNIITIEDPIEILHVDKRGMVNQREVRVDTEDFGTALRAAMRQDPDVILVGEMRDQETVKAALAAAETGHFVMSTLHTVDAQETISRIIDFFPPHERDQIRILLAESLLGIFSQRLLARADEGGRVLALELLINTPLIRDYIKDEEKTPLVKEALMQDNLRGMQTFDQHLVELYLAGRITMEDATFTATSPHEFRLMVTQRQGGVGPDELRDVTGAGMHPSRGLR